MSNEDVYIEQIEKLKKEIEKKNNELKHLKKWLQKYEGRIEGLEYAIRCNGISGMEVKA